MPDYSVIESQKEIDYRIYFTCHGRCYAGSFADLRGTDIQDFLSGVMLGLSIGEVLAGFFPSRLLFSL